MKLTLILNYKNPETVRLAEELRVYIERKGLSLLVPDDKPGYSPADCEKVSFGGVDLAIVMGGDGTLLAVCRHMLPNNIPILMMNMGKMGFLAEVEKNEIFDAIDQLADNNYFVESRMMLKGRVERMGGQVTGFTALNDFVVNDGEVSRSIILDLFVDDEQVYSFRTDGLIVSTPTGSTAYSLSAGGPIVMPDVQVMIITPICPHNLFSRPVVIDPRHKIRIAFRSASGSCRLTADGQSRCLLEQGDEIIIEASEQQARLAKLKRQRFFTTLHKLAKDYV